MRLLVVAVAIVSLTVLAGCAQTRCATQAVGRTGQSVGQSVGRAGQAVGRAGQTVGHTASSAWRSVTCAVDRATDCACQPEPETMVTCPVYADCCGGDQGVGRSGTGAFTIPAAP